jgi:hypothetical protein
MVDIKKLEPNYSSQQLSVAGKHTWVVLELRHGSMFLEKNNI